MANESGSVQRVLKEHGDKIAFAAAAITGAVIASSRSTRKDESRAEEVVAARSDVVEESKTSRELVRFYRTPALSKEEEGALGKSVSSAVGDDVRVTGVRSEVCFYVDFGEGKDWSKLSLEARESVLWVLSETFAKDRLCRESVLREGVVAAGAPGGETEVHSQILEVGPRLSFTSAFSTNAVAILDRVGVEVSRLERYRRYEIQTTGRALSAAEMEAVAGLVHDRMTEMVVTRLESFESGVEPKSWTLVKVLEEGKSAVEAANVALGLGLDAWDVDFVVKVFRDLGRNPTSVELFDLAQSNSEHSRHWFFKGQMVIDGEEMEESLMEVVGATHKAQSGNSIIAFEDNSSAIRGFTVPVLSPWEPGAPAPLVSRPVLRHLLLTAETHNFPTGVAPFPGAETGTGGRIRDTHATGRGSHCIAGVCGYSVGNLNLPEHRLSWEDATWGYPSTMASPAKIAIDASNGASEYGNKFGEPVVCGFFRSFGGVSGGERREWVKPIMFSAGIGAIDDDQTVKGAPEEGMLVVKLGGPAYRIGMGGSAASSVTHGSNDASLDFDAVQRGDAEMAQKLNRAVRACAEMGEHNPIVSIHDQGAGGNCNVLKEIVEPLGARIDIRAIRTGDPTMSVLELWGAEYQEADAILVRPESKADLVKICTRERCGMDIVGTVSDDGRVVVRDSSDGTTPVDLHLEKVLGNVPRKVFRSDRTVRENDALQVQFAPKESWAVLSRVLSVPAVASKRWLTTKVDRSVTGCVAQQQCVGPLHTPLADCAVLATSPLGKAGVASAVGEQPIKGLVDSKRGARLSVAEAVLNLCGAGITSLRETKCSANWMWAAKLEGEGAALWDAAQAMRDTMLTVGIAVDGGKDSLSMAARAPDGSTIKAPGTLTVTLYAPCPDVSVVATPDLKVAGLNSHPMRSDEDLGDTSLVWIAGASRVSLFERETPRCGGSALAQSFAQVGMAEETPDVDDAQVLRDVFGAVQSLVRDGTALAMHDVSDGGVLVAACEMAFAGNCGLDLTLPAELEAEHALLSLFAEEPAVLVQVPTSEVSKVERALGDGAAWLVLGRPTKDNRIKVQIEDGPALLLVAATEARDAWESTSFALDELQASRACVRAEKGSMAMRFGKSPYRHLSFAPAPLNRDLMRLSPRRKHAVAVIREEGSNGDREMSAALFAAGLCPWDVTMSDLSSSRISLDRFRGVIFVGGFSYADVLDSAKGWAATIELSPKLRDVFRTFKERKDTFSLGICNGCQLLALLGWTAPPTTLERRPRFVRNNSHRFESRWVSLQIQRSNAVLLKGMQGSTIGTWVAHGEGRAYFPDSDIMQHILQNDLAPLRYVDDDNKPTETYPFNPNGSPHGIAGMCSPDGRHLALMPHPERSVFGWQVPWGKTEQQDEVAPWIQLFHNARAFCDETEPLA